MPFWIYGSDLETGRSIDPFFSGAESEAVARAEAGAQGIVVESVERLAEPRTDWPNPFSGFTDGAHQVMHMANQEAHRTNHEYIGTEHILFGLLREDSGAAAAILRNLRIPRRKIRRAVEKILQYGPNRLPAGQLPLTPRARNVIGYAKRESLHLKDSHIDTEHLLLGLLREEQGAAGQVLLSLGLRLASLREEVRADRRRCGSAPGESGKPWWRFW